MGGCGAAARPGTPSGPAADAARAATAPAPPDPTRPRPGTPGPASRPDARPAPSSTTPSNTCGNSHGFLGGRDRRGQPRGGHRVTPACSRGLGTASTAARSRAGVGMQVNLRRGDRRVSEQIGDHVDPGSGIEQRCCRRRVAAGAGGPGVQPGPARSRGHQLADRVRPHRRADAAAEQVDEHEVAVRGLRHPHALELVDVERLHHKEIQRHHPLPARLGPRPVRVVLPAHHMQMRPRHLAAQRGANPPAGAHRCAAARTPPRGAARPAPSAARSAGPAPTGTPAAARRSARRWPGPPPSPVPAADAGPASATPSDRPRRGPPPAGPGHRPPRTASTPDPPRRARSRPRAPPCPAPRSAPR